MKVKHLLTALLIGIFCMTVSIPTARAEEGKFELKKSTTMKELLLDRMGKKTTLRMQSGEDIEGTIVIVGEGLVHITKLTNKDFYDAVVSIDRISAVIMKVRDR